jgi:undecaprenyl-diphosphatase
MGLIEQGKRMTLETLDHHLFLWINHSWQNGIFDFVMPILTDLNHNFFVQTLYLPALLIMWLVFSRIPAWPRILGLALSLSASDWIPHHLIKPYFQRHRPQDLGLDVILRTHLHYGYSFPSIHAMNVFAAAAFLSTFYPRARSLFYLMAVLVAFSRIYVGVHFPSDVLCGAILGWLIGRTVGYLLNQAEEKARRSPSEVSP